MKRPEEREIILDGGRRPSLEMLSEYVGSVLWDDLNCYLQTAYRTEPELGYSCCSARRGWNVKYRKAGRALCTLYPERGSFRVLVVIGRREEPVLQPLLPELSAGIVRLYEKTGRMAMGRWLMIRVSGEEALRDVKTLIALRRRPQAGGCAADKAFPQDGAHTDTRGF
jgi:hypothetical protein